MTANYEHWYDAGRSMSFVRCHCWRHLKGSDGIAPGNGWFQADRPYPHAQYCSEGKS